MNIVIKFFKHLNVVNKHRWYVFKLSCKAGIPFRGLVHDLSKFSPDEFWESVKYFNGKRSPLAVCREDIGYSKAWIHHKGRNKHHLEYWEDSSSKGRLGVFMPYKYAVESVCDKVAAGMAYKGKEWNQDEPYNYWKEKELNFSVARHEGSVEFITTVLKKIADEGLDAGLKKSYTKALYKSIKEKYNVK